MIKLHHFQFMSSNSGISQTEFPVTHLTNHLADLLRIFQIYLRECTPRQVWRKHRNSWRNLHNKLWNIPEGMDGNTSRVQTVKKWIRRFISKPPQVYLGDILDGISKRVPEKIPRIICEGIDRGIPEESQKWA